MTQMKKNDDKPKTILGVLVDPAYYRDLKNGVKMQTAEWMLETAEQYGMTLFFLMEDGVQSKDSWSGLIWDGEKWGKAETFPDILYDKAYTASKAIRDHILAISSLKTINQKIGYWKWEVYEALKRSCPGAVWLVETELVKSMDTLERFLKGRSLVFLKPSKGLKSMGVVRLEKREGRFFYEYRGKGKDKLLYKRGDAAHLDGLPAEVLKWLRNEQYIIQEGIMLASIEGRHFDLRVLGQKNLKGEWQLYPKAKVGQPGHSITTLGLWSDAELVLEEVFPHKKLLSAVLNTAQEILLELDKGFARAGEIGLDLAVDTKGKVFFLEANSMPGKSMYSGPIFKNIIKNPVEYARFLHELSNKQAL